VLDTALDCIVTIDHEGTITDFNPACEKTFGFSRAEAIGREMGELIVPPSLRAQHRAGLARYVSTGEAKVLNRRIELTAMRADGSEFPVELAITRISGSGTPQFTGYLRDITERKNAEKRQQILTNELNHRVKNMLSVIQSIAHHTARATPDPKQFFDAFSERLVGMARVHDMLTANTWKGADLRAIAEATFSPYRRTDMDNVRFSGPAIILSPDASVSIGLALHELATNAAKYGALSQPTGRVDVTWKEVAGSRRIALDWRESGGPAVQQPVRQGFGTRLIEMVASQLAAEISIDYAKEGVICRMEFPLRDAAREADPAASQ
jgi:PAS domain S-box-containing protein